MDAVAAAAQLDRLANAFGRDATVPLISGLRDELRVALATIEQGDRPDAHKLAGLTGTVGLTAACEAWRAIDEGGGSLDAAQVATVEAVRVIERWLAADA